MNSWRCNSDERPGGNVCACIHHKLERQKEHAGRRFAGSGQITCVDQSGSSEAIHSLLLYEAVSVHRTTSLRD